MLARQVRANSQQSALFAVLESKMLPRGSAGDYSTLGKELKRVQENTTSA
jgi:hypothetical protein